MDPRDSETGRMGQAQMREIARLFSVVEGERRYFQELAASLPQALAIFDARSLPVWTNSAFRRTYGAAPALSDVLPTAGLRLAAKRILDGAREDYSEEFDDGTRYVRFTLKPNDNWAAEAELLLMVEDFTAPLEAVRHEMAARYAPLEAIAWELDAVRMEFLRVDQAAAEKLGFEGALWSRGRSFWSRRLHSAELPHLRALYQTAPGGVIACEYRSTDATGRTRWLSDRARVVDNRVTGVTEDITVRVDQAQMAQRAARIDAQHALARTVAHENNNLLMILHGYGEDLLQGLPAESPLQTNIREILAASERLAAHTRTLASYTAKQPPPAAERIALDTYLSQHREALMTALPPGSELTLHPATDGARVSVDPARLTDCLRALIQSLHGPTRMATARAGAGTLRLTIGSTIGNAVPANVFEISTNPTFAQGPALHAAYLFLRESGGNVVVRDTGYEVLLPYLPDTPAARREPDLVLVVDDEDSIRSLIRKVLERAGYRVLEAASGPAAIQLAMDHEGPIGLLLTDVVMPGMSGLELAENLSLRRPEIRTLLISGQTGEAALSASRLPHGFEFLQKPFSLPDLLGKVQSLLDQARR